MTDIALYLPSLHGGGAERVMVILANGLAERGYAVDLVAASAEGPCRADVSPAVRIVDLGAKRVITSAPGLIRYLIRAKPKSMLSALSHANVVAVLANLFAGTPTRIVVTEHTNASQSRIRSKGLSAKVVQTLMRWTYSKADAVVAVSNGVADDLAKTLGLPRSQVKVIYNPVVTAKLFECADAPLDHPWLVPGAPPVILGVGRLTSAKDFSTLIKAFARVRERHACRLVILGEGELRDSLESLIKKLNLDADVLLPGFSENPFAWMKRSKIFVLSSAWEGLPTVLIEALACGASVVSTDCPSGPAEILENGVWGALVPVGAPAKLASAIELKLSQSNTIDCASRALYFNVENAVDGYLKVLR